MLGSNNGELLLVEEGDELKCGCQWLGLFLLELGKKNLLSSLPFVVRTVNQREAKMTKKNSKHPCARLERG